MTVHDVEMDPVGASLIDCADLLAQFGEIGSQDRRGNEQRTHRFLSLNPVLGYHGEGAGATRRASGFNIAGIR